MGCTMCEFAVNSGDKYYYRWGVANILIVGCSLHVKEVMDVLRDYQKDSKEKSI